MPITSGSIRYERRLPKDDANTWNYKHVVSEIHWVVEPGEDEDVLAAFAVDKVVMRVKDVLNWKPPVPDDMLVLATEIDLENKPEPEPKLENKAAPNLAAQHAVAEITADNFSIAPGAHPPEHNTVGIPPALKRHRRTKAEMEAARAAAEVEVWPNLEGPTPAPESKSSTVSGEPTLSSNGATEPGMPSFDPDPEPPAEVTDQALLDACQAKASSGKPVADIKELVAKFSPGGLVQTPKNARRRFLDDLAKL